VLTGVTFLVCSVLLLFVFTSLLDHLSLLDKADKFETNRHFGWVSIWLETNACQRLRETRETGKREKKGEKNGGITGYRYLPR
jgi:hypothetical protein